MYDFSGYATKNNLVCSDGRVILEGAFKHDDKKTVPLVWQHMHNDPANVLGHAELENRSDGVYAYCYFNESDSAKTAKELIRNGDVNALSIFANKLKQKGNQVLHGAIKEVSLVLSGANPGAFIDNISFAHADGTFDISDEEAIIYSDTKIETSSQEKEKVKMNDKKSDKTVEEIFNELTDEQKQLVYYLVGAAVEGDGEAEHDDLYEGGNMKNNIFDNTTDSNELFLTHDDMVEIIEDAKKNGSLKEAFLAHTAEYGIENIEYLFPDAKTVTPTPDFIKRDSGWVEDVISNAKHSPFSRIKSTAADITADEARAKGYTKGKKKKEEVIKLLKRVTTPTTVYKKQKLDRDDMVDITDLDVVVWLKAEMRSMLNEELARAALVGDGRDAENEDKINEDNIRPIYKDDEMYSHKVLLEHNVTFENMIDEIVRARKEYKGKLTPTLYTTTETLTEMLLLKDKMGRKLYNSVSDLASALRVAKIVEVPVMEGLKRKVDEESWSRELIGIIVNMNDYTFGADKGGEVSLFDDFDIDYNQYKYLMETRCSGALIHPKTAIVLEKKDQ